MEKKFILFLFSIIFLLHSVIPTTQAAEKIADAAVVAKPLPVGKTDTRVKTLKAFLETRDSPLTPYAGKLVETADANNIDWKLLVAISGVESTFGKNIPYNSYNGWGWGIYGDQTKRFTSWNEAIETISQGLGENYVKRLGTDDVYAIGRIYAASPTWASRVEFFMNQIQSEAEKPSAQYLSLTI